MDYRSVQTADRRNMAHLPQQQKPLASAKAGGFHDDADSDRSTTLDSLRDLMAFNQRPRRARHEDILLAAKHARTQMPAHFREPPSSTGSHGTITVSSIHLDGGVDDDHHHRYRNYDSDNQTVDSSPSTLSGGPDAESTRASVFYQRGSHRVHKSTGRFGSGGEEEKRKATTKKTKTATSTDFLSGAINTSALFRTFKEWKPDDASNASDPSIFEDADADADADAGTATGTHHDAESTTNFGLIENLARYDQENCVPIQPLSRKEQREPSESKEQKDPSDRKPQGRPLADMQERRNRRVLQATVQNESDMSIVVAASVQKPAASRASPLRKASAAAAAKKQQQQKTAAVASPLLDELTSPETSAGTREDVDLGVRTVAAPVPTQAATPTTKRASSAPIVPTMHNNNDAVTNQSFIVPSKSFPLLHNLVTGTLRFTPGKFVYGAAGEAQRRYQLPPGPVPEDEKEIFVDMENIRDEVMRLQEHDEMLQNEIIQGEIKYKALLDRFYSMAHKPMQSGHGSDHDDQSLKKAREQSQQLSNRIQDLEKELDVVHTRYEQQVQSSADLAAQRDDAERRAAAAADEARRLTADLEAARERLSASSHRPNQEAQRRIHQLEKMVAERERVIKALKDEREAASSSYREACRLHKERISRMEAEKSMLSGDHAKCDDEKYALATAKDALLEKNSALRAKVQAARQQGKDREAAAHAIVERQRLQITKLQRLLRDKESSVRELDENFRKLRESWSAKDDTLARMTADMLDQRPTHAADAETTHDAASDGKNNDDNHGQGLDENDNDDDSDATASNSGQSAMDDSMDENMTSAFIVPDIEFHAEDGEREEAENNGDEDGVDEQELAHELEQVRHAAAEAATAEASSKSTKTKSVSFQMRSGEQHTGTTAAMETATAVCKHKQVNCVVCCQKAGAVGQNEKVKVVVPRPLPARGDATRQAETVLPDAAMDPGSALAYVMKLLDDERRHLWMQIQASRRRGEAEEALNERRRPRQALREAEELWNAYVRKVEQLNRLDDVLEGQREAGQDMTREEIDVTITRILEV